MKKIFYYFALGSLILLNYNYTNAQSQDGKRLNAYTQTWNDGSQVHTRDSTHYEWDTGEGTADYTKFPEEYWGRYFAYPYDNLPTILNKYTLPFNKIDNERFEWNSTAGLFEKLNKQEVDLNGDGNLTEKRFLEKDGNDWTVVRKSEVTYLSNNRIESTAEYFYDYGLDSLVKSNKIFYSYDNDGNFTTVQVQEPDGANWKNSINAELNYINQKLAGVELYAWDDGAGQWESQPMEKQLWHYNTDELVDSYKYKDLTTGLLIEEKLFTYNSNDSIESSLFYSYDSYGDLDFKDSTVYEYNGEDISSVIEFKWNDDDKIFEKSGKATFSYDGELLNEIHNEVWDDGAGEWTDVFPAWSSARTTYKFHYGETSGIAENTKDFEFKLYPNPSTDKVQIETPENRIKNIQITNVSGKVVYENKKDLNTNKVSIPVQQFKSGVYYIHAQGQNSKSVKSFIVN